MILPVKVDRLEGLLLKSGYNVQKTAELMKSFQEGFSIGYEGPENVQRKSPNLKLSVGTEVDLWNKVMKEVKLKRYAGPYKIYHLTVTFKARSGWFLRMEEMTLD